MPDDFTVLLFTLPTLPTLPYMFRLATRGRLVTIGFITGYQSKLGFPPVKNSTIVPKVMLSTNQRAT